MKIAMLGTRGVPARYGGFETAVEEVGSRLVKAGHEVVVYCRNVGQTQRSHLGMTLINLPSLRRRSLETVSHTALSAIHAVIRQRPDVVVLFNAANAPLIPLLRGARLPVAVHIDGLEWQRAKWHGLGQRYYRFAEGMSVRLGDDVIADARGIVDYVHKNYGRDSTFIAYGAPLVDPDPVRLGEMGLEADRYHLAVARFEPENHVLEIVQGFVGSECRMPLVVVGSAPYADAYTASIRAASHGDSRVRFVGPVWDQDLLDQLYANCRSYLHGHSVGGTNPSLLRALGAAAPVTAFDVAFNHEVTNGHARFFADQREVAAAVAADERDELAARRRGRSGREHVRATYVWDDVANAYEELCLRLSASRARPVR